MIIQRPERSEVFQYYQGYVDQVSGDDLLAAFDHAGAMLQAYASGVPQKQEGFRYAPSKWSIKEVIQHLNDTERILSYRALRFARNDAQELHSFDENAYAVSATCEGRTLSDLIEEHTAIRRCTIALFRSFTPEMLTRSGTASDNRNSVRGIGWSIAGHAMHHLRVLNEHYYR